MYGEREVEVPLQNCVPTPLRARTHTHTHLHVQGQAIVVAADVNKSLLFSGKIGVVQDIGGFSLTCTGNEKKWSRVRPKSNLTLISAASTN